jgi:uncharacterized membrane protein
MIRDHLFNKKLGADPFFRWRGGEISRIEGMSDGIFAITITLLIVSTTNSNTFYNIWLTLRDIPATLISFAIIIYAWYEHYIFFRRYGLEDSKTVFLNSLFLFLIMVLAYPLKFLCLFLWHIILGIDTTDLFQLPSSASIILSENLNQFTQRLYMMYFYSFSLLGVYLILALMHFRAYFLRNELELDKVELLITNSSLLHHSVTIIIASISIIVLYLTSKPGISGIIYFLMPLIHIPLSMRQRKKINNQ